MFFRCRRADDLIRESVRVDSHCGFLVSLASVFIIACLVYLYERMVGVAVAVSCRVRPIEHSKWGHA